MYPKMYVGDYPWGGEPECSCYGDNVSRQGAKARRKQRNRICGGHPGAAWQRVRFVPLFPYLCAFAPSREPALALRLPLERLLEQHQQLVLERAALLRRKARDLCVHLHGQTQCQRLEYLVRRWFNWHRGHLFLPPGQLRPEHDEAAGTPLHALRIGHAPYQGTYRRTH